MTVNITCPCCKQAYDYTSTLSIRVGDRFQCTCNKTLSIIKMSNPVVAEEVKAPRFTMIKEKHV